MKKILLFLVVLLLLAAAGGVIFLLTFDVNSLKPYLREQIEKQLGQPVEISDIGLGWKNGIALNVDGLTVYKDAAKEETPVISVDSVSGHLDFNALLKSRLEISSLTVDRLKLDLYRDLQGRIRGLDKIGADTNASASAGQGLSLVFLIKDIYVRNGEVIYQDAAVRDAGPLALKDIDIHVQDVSLSGPITVEAGASFYSSRSNLQASGTVQLNLLKQTVQFEGWKLETDLGELDLAALQRDQPAFRDAGLNKLEGRLSASLPALTLQDGVPGQTALDLNLSRGRVESTGFVLPFEGFDGRVEWAGNSLYLNSATLRLEQGQLVGSGSLKALDQDPVLDFNIIAKDIYLPQYVQVREGDPYLDGMMTLTFKGSAAALKTAGIDKTLQGQGLILVSNAVLKNINVLDQVFSSLSILPGLVNRLKSRLPEEYVSKFNSPDTPLKDVKLPFDLAQGKIFMNQIGVQAEQFQLEGRAEASLEGSVFANLMLRLDTYLTEALVRSVEELRYLSNPRGEMEIPLVVKGTAPAIKPFPDLGYIGSKLAVAKTQDLLQGFLDRNKKEPAAQETGAPAESAAGQTAVSADQSQTTPAPVPSRKATAEALFGQLLKEVLQPAENQTTAETKAG